MGQNDDGQILWHWITFWERKFRWTHWYFNVYDGLFRQFELTLIVMQCVMDPPCCFFAEELSKAYPEAKVVLNGKRIDSMEATLFSVFRGPSWEIFHYLNPSGCGEWVQSL